MDALMKGREDAEWKELFRENGSVLPGEAEILKGTDMTDKGRMKEQKTGPF